MSDRPILRPTKPRKKTRMVFVGKPPLPSSMVELMQENEEVFLLPADATDEQIAEAKGTSGRCFTYYASEADGTFRTYYRPPPFDEGE